jgi:hypothetical protein
MQTQPTENPRRSLRNLVDELLVRLDQSEGVVDDYVDGLELSIVDKVEAYAVVYAQLMAESGAFDELSRGYRLRAATRQGQAEALRTRLLESMRRIGTEKIAAPTVTAYVLHNTHVSVTDPLLLPANLVRVVQQPDKKAIRMAIDAGVSVPGACIEKSESLVFR